MISRETFVTRSISDLCSFPAILIPVFKHHTRLVTSALCLAAYGHKVTSPNDTIVEMMEGVDVLLKSVGTVGSTPVDIFPPRTSYVPTNLSRHHNAL